MGTTRHLPGRRDGLSSRYLRKRAHVDDDQIARGYEGLDHSLEVDDWTEWERERHRRWADSRPHATQTEHAWRLVRDRASAQARFNPLPLTISRVPCALEPKVFDRSTLEDRLLDYLERMVLPAASPEAQARPLLDLIQPDADLDDEFGVLLDRSQEFSPELLANLALTRPFWLRSPASFRGTRVDQLVSHLLVHYPVPRFLLRLWTETPALLQPMWIVWLIALGQGASLRRLSQRASALGLPHWWALPKRFCTHLAHAPASLGPWDAVMLAEVHRAGGSVREYRWLRANTSYILRPTDISAHDFAFWRATIRWLAVHGDTLSSARVGMLLGWARHEHVERSRRGRPAFSWTDYTPHTALAHAEAYHFELRGRWRYRYGSWAPRREVNLGWKRHGWDWKTTIDGVEWELRELVTSAALRQESQVMRHCVRLYDSRCAHGYCAIFSLLRAGKRRLTIEVRLPKRRIVQALGKANRGARPNERAVVEAWRRACLVDD